MKHLLGRDCDVLSLEILITLITESFVCSDKLTCLDVKAIYKYPTVFSTLDSLFRRNTTLFLTFFRMNHIQASVGGYVI